MGRKRQVDPVVTVPTQEGWFSSHELSKSHGQLLGYRKIICKIGTIALNTTRAPLLH